MMDDSDMGRTPDQDIGYVKGLLRGVDRRVDDLQVSVDRRLDEQAKAMRDMKDVLDSINATMQQNTGSAAAYKKISGLVGGIAGAIAGAVGAHMFRGAP